MWEWIEVMLLRLKYSGRSGPRVGFQDAGAVISDASDASGTGGELMPVTGCTVHVEVDHVS